jgi:predicted alpha/beta-hydrolase family hydrolase
VFPLHPPGRPEKSRLPELDAVKVPTLVVQGESDPRDATRQPEPHPRRIPGTHSLKNETTVAAAVSEWLASLSSDFFERT